MNNNNSKPIHRRVSSLGLLNKSFFDEHYLQPAQQMHNAEFTTIPQPQSLVDQKMLQDCDHLTTNRSIKSKRIANTNNKHLVLKSTDKHLLLDSTNNSVNIARAFRNAMQRTQKSQQEIHNWDKKMGLRRSHSKVMRLSFRSRKQLCKLLKKKNSSRVFFEMATAAKK